MTAAYRACWYQAGDGAVRLTGPEHAHLSDDELRAEALAEAERAHVIGEAPPYLTREQIIAGLVIGEWTGGVR